MAASVRVVPCPDLKACNNGEKVPSTPIAVLFSSSSAKLKIAPVAVLVILETHFSKCQLTAAVAKECTVVCGSCGGGRWGGFRISKASALLVVIWGWFFKKSMYFFFYLPVVFYRWFCGC
ncbi:hypothetical protein Adt_48628 [Abeliophyllum distichum]|uniref:Uncharacterized protein n=1 Tax=Abeliophyllum distichum TaxID=126358 RepID=A0ABD1NQG9_9LAMI